MVVQHQAEIGEHLEIPTDPHHTPTLIQPTQPQKTQKPRKRNRKDTQIPQSSGPTEHVADEAIYEERSDSLVRAATTASSLEAEHDSSNINKTRSKATPNKAGSQGTTLGGGPRCQETMGDTIAQTSLKRRVKRLEKKGRSRTYKLKRLYKVGLTATVDSSEEEEVLGKDASKQGRINDINEDEDITLVSVQDDADAKMFDVNTLTGEEVVVVEEINERRDVVNDVAEVIKTAQVSTSSAKVSTASATTTTTTTEDDLTLAQALADLKSTKPKAKRIAFREPGESKTTTTTPIPSKVQDKGKEKMVEPEKPLKKKDQISFDEETARRLQAEFDEDERLAREKDKANVALTEEWDDIQAKIEADYKLA
ncbi:hypothetical protein Tco_1495355 [Tanacetum coccineum]